MITIKALLAAKPGEWLSDGGARGAGTLLFRRTASGAVLAYFRYTLTDGKRDTLAIGQFSESGRDGLTLAEARAKAGELSRLYQSGKKNIRAHLETEEATKKADLEAAKTAVETARQEAATRLRYTLCKMLEIYTKSLENSGKSSSAKHATSAFNNHVIDAHPSLSNSPAREITPHQIATIIRLVREAGKERMAGILRSYLHAAFSAAIRAPFDSSLPADFIPFDIQSNPVDAIPTVPINAGFRTLSPAELSIYILTLQDSIIDQALKLALFSGGQRMAQLLRARATDYNKATQTLRLWDGKGRRRKAREHMLPLGPIGVALVEELIKRAHLKATAMAKDDNTIGNPYLFISTGGAIIANSTPGKRVAEIATDMKGEPFDLRDIRRTVETQLASLGVSRDVRAQLLSHGLSGVQNQHYDRHSYMDEKRTALLLWERHLETLRENAQTTI